jgi:acyl-CoA thioesterase YciA
MALAALIARDCVLGFDDARSVMSSAWRPTMPHRFDEETLTHRLILPRDANHYGTLFAGGLLSLALEAAYATAYRTIGANANLVLKRVLDVRCFEPVKVGRVIEIRGREVHRARAMVVIGLHGTPQPQRPKPWMDGLMQFVQVDPSGRPIPIEAEMPDRPPELALPWGPLRDRAIRLLAVRGSRS